jgi:hypothetical protein
MCASETSVFGHSSSTSRQSGRSSSQCFLSISLFPSLLIGSKLSSETVQGACWSLNHCERSIFQPWPRCSGMKRFTGTSNPPSRRMRNSSKASRADCAAWGSISTAATDDFCEIAVVLCPRWWGQGTGSAALAWLHSTVQADHGINLFYATTHPQNARCQRLLIRNGYSEIHSVERRLLSYEAGDLIFRYSMEENNEPDKTMARSV